MFSFPTQSTNDDEDKPKKQTAQFTVVEGEADEEEEEEEEEEEADEEQVVKKEPVVAVEASKKIEQPPAVIVQPVLPSPALPTLQLPRRTNDEPPPKFDNTNNYSSLFTVERDTTEDYVATELQRKVIRQNIQFRKTLANKFVDVFQPANKTFEIVTPQISESIVVFQDVSQYFKNINEDLTAIGEALGELNSFPASLFNSYDRM